MDKENIFGGWNKFKELKVRFARAFAAFSADSIPFNQ